MTNTVATTHWYDDNSPTITGALDHEVRRLQSLARMGWQKEARTLQQFGLRDGMKVLEIGSGPGFYTEQLATLVPNGSITSVEYSGPMVEQARTYLSTRKLPCKYEIIQATANKMPLEDNSYDFAMGRLLFQHFPDPTVEAREIMRVLKPGGHLVVIDLEFDIAPVTDPAIPQHKVLREKSIAVNKKMGSDIHIGSKLWRVLKKSGYVKLDVEIMALHSGYQSIKEFLPQLNPDLALPLVKAGLLEQEALDKLRTEIDSFLQAEDPFYMRPLVAVGGTKPA